jgi:outer membrane lipoprotein-sorting protein
MIGLSWPYLEELPYIYTMHHKRTESLAPAVFTFLALVTIAPVGGPASAQEPKTSPASAPAQPRVSAPAQPPASAPPAATGPAVAKPAEPAQEPPTEAERLIDEAIKKIAGLKSVSADLVQTVDMLKQKFEIRGRYLKAPSSRVYLKLSVSGLPDSAGTIVQVCDGETLWDSQQIFDSKSYRKLSIRPVFERLNSPDMDPKIRDQIVTQLGFSGPETLLVGLRKSIKFDIKEEDTLDGKPVWVLRGTWRNRSGLVGPDQRPLPPTGPLPAYVPSVATLTVGKDDGWPYKLVMVGKVPTILVTPRAGSEKAAPGKRPADNIEPSLLTLVYSGVKLNPEIKAEEFVFTAPPSASVEDNTEVTIKGLDQLIQTQLMQKRAEAARQEGPVLEQQIDVPKMPADPTPK